MTPIPMTPDIVRIDTAEELEAAITFGSAEYMIDRGPADDPYVQAIRRAVEKEEKWADAHNPQMQMLHLRTFSRMIAELIKSLSPDEQDDMIDTILTRYDPHPSEKTGMKIIRKLFGMTRQARAKRKRGHTGPLVRMFGIKEGLYIATREAGAVLRLN